MCYFQETVSEWSDCTTAALADFQLPELAFCQSEVGAKYYDGMDLPEAVDIIISCLEGMRAGR